MNDKTTISPNSPSRNSELRQGPERLVSWTLQRFSASPHDGYDRLVWKAAR
ncbi:MAG: hypothetical protein ABJD11_14435 [Gemmatimonadota bacterium]